MKYTFPLHVLVIFSTLTLCANGKENINSLQNQFRIENDILIAANGIKYPHITYASKLHEDLAYVLKDPDQALSIHNAYIKHILPILEPTDKQNSSNEVEAPEDLLYFLKDPNFRKYFEDAHYQTNISNKSNSISDAFGKGLLEVCILFGHPKFPP